METIKILTMEITEAIQAMRGKDTFTDVLIDIAEMSHNNLNEFVAHKVSQYKLTTEIKDRMDKRFTEEVMDCLVDYAKG